MKFIYIDTTTPDLVVAVVKDNQITNCSRPKVGVHHSEWLCQVVEEALAKSCLRFADLDAYACAIGPGSFTGIRIGISTVKGYCTACPKPYVAVNSLQAIATSANFGAKGKAIVNAGNGYYFADYQTGVAPCLVPYEDHCVQGLKVPDGACDYLDGALTLVANAINQQKFDDNLHPLYIRRSQAEENAK